MTMETRGVTKEFPRTKGGAVFTAVEPVDLRLERGEVMVIRGRSGSGKSTLLSMLAGMLTPTAGTVLVDDQDLYSLDDKALSRLRNEKIGVIPQGHAALRSLSVFENVLLPSVIYAEAEGSALRTRAQELLESVGLSALTDSSPNELSGGELRRMAVARALLMSPQAVLADEPTSGLDDDNSAVVLEMLRRAADEGAAVLVVTHDDGAVRFADRVFTMDGGSLRS